MRIRPQAVIFDYGNVLSQPQPLADIEAMAAILELPASQFREFYWRFRLAYDSAELDPPTYWNAVARTAARELTPAQIADLVEIDSRSWAHPAPSVPEWAHALARTGIRIALLSNMPVPVREHVVGCAWLPRFDNCTFSCDLGISKPSPAIYLHCLQELGVSPAEALFLDDREENVRAAEALGMHGVEFTTPAKAAAEVEERFALPTGLA